MIVLMRVSHSCQRAASGLGEVVTRVVSWAAMVARSAIGRLRRTCEKGFASLLLGEGSKMDVILGEVELGKVCEVLNAALERIGDICWSVRMGW